ncbi:hypothetical protein [Streptosporangium saharense]|uniref:Uncharacterized protein n=1 Tax=Streptosporangium saharense TaxID=1706840 RepID=A0A7W7QP86_9ACTN|nr:hypothetical protein [Streptosporangium saharense]MBB4917259.1 hypothetical protein [Streptosporangium saharense]
MSVRTTRPSPATMPSGHRIVVLIVVVLVTVALRMSGQPLPESLLLVLATGGVAAQIVTWLASGTARLRWP